MQSWDKMRDLEKFQGIDYMIPTLSKDSTGVIARPSAADGALRWLKAALHRHWGATTDPSILANLTWHSFRVFVPGSLTVHTTWDSHEINGNTWETGPQKQEQTSTPGTNGM